MKLIVIYKYFYIYIYFYIFGSDPHMDSFVSFVASTDNADKVLRVVCYAGRLVSAFLLRGGPGVAGYGKRLAALLASVSEARVVLRLFGLPQTLHWLLQLDVSDRDFQYRMLQVVSMLVYYPMEHVYWASMRGALTMADAEHLSIVSCRAWFLYLAVEACLLLREWRQLEDPSTFPEADDRGRIAEALSETLKRQRQLKAKRRALLLRTIAVLGDIPLALTWSVPRSFLSDTWIGMFGTASSIAGIIQKWSNLK